MALARAAPNRSASSRPPGGVSGWSSKPRQSSSISWVRCSLTRLLASATKQKGQTKSDQSVTRRGMVQGL